MSENRWGTVFMGPTSDRESRLDKITNREEQDLWNRRTEAEYLRRVKERAVEQLNAMLAEAQEQAAGLLAAANTDADIIRAQAQAVLDAARKDRKAAADELAEATRIREEAYDEGYGRGVEQAMIELDEQREKIDSTTLSVLKAMETQCGGLFESWRDELAALVRQSVETGLGWVLREDRAEVLEGLLGKALDALENHRRIVVRANPEDVPAVEAVMDGVRRRFNELKSWDVQADETMAPGGLVVESVSGKVESRADTRREVVEQALRHLTIPSSEADAKAEDAVQDAAEQAGVPALEQAVQDAGQRALERAEAKAALEAAAAQEAAEKEAAAHEAAARAAAENEAIANEVIAQDAIANEAAAQAAIPAPQTGKALPAAESDAPADSDPPDAPAMSAAPEIPAEPDMPDASDVPAAPEAPAGPEFAGEAPESVLSVDEAFNEDGLTPEAALALDIPPELADLLAANPDDDPEGEAFDKFMQESMDSVRKAGEA